MAKPQLNELFDWLKRRDANRFEIYNVDTGEPIDKCASYDDLVAGGITPEQYFTRLLEKGIRTVQIQKKRKNGSTWIREGCGLNYSLSTDAQNNVAASGRTESPAATQQHPNYGLMGNASVGLSVPELMNERYRETKMTADELKQKLEKLEAENRRLDRDNLILENDLKREKERRDEDLNKKPSNIDVLVEKLMENPSAIPGIIQAFKGSPNPGLNAPATPQMPQLSDTKSQVIDTISNPQIADKDVAAAYYVIVQLASGNKEFEKEYEQLLIKYNLISDGSDNSSDSV